MVNQRDLANALGMNQSTVSRALAGSPEVSPDIVARVREYAKRVGYRPWKADPSVLLGRIPTISVLNPGDFYIVENWAREIRRMQSIAKDCGYRLRIDHDSEYAKLCEEHSVDGFIILGEDQGIVNCGSVVYLDREAEDGNPRVFGMNNHEGGRLAARHLHGLGHRTFCFFGYIDASGICRARYGGWTDFLEDAGVRRDGLFLVHLPSWPGKPGVIGISSEADVATALSRGVTAFFTPSDIMALGLIGLLRRMGVRVPEDVSVMGYDDMELAQDWYPPLTTIRQPLDGVSEDALRALIAFIEMGDMEYRHGEHMPELIVRGSTGPARQGRTG